jgi:hypothetical protein
VDLIWTVHNLKEAGLSLDSEKVVLYVRNESVELWDALNKQLESSLTNPNTLFFIEGAPGIGKSTELFGWFLWSTATSKKNGCWIHGNVDGSLFYVVEYLSNAWSYSLISSILEFSFENTKYDVVVLDAIRSDLVTTITLAKRNNVPLVITCNSYSQSFNTETVSFLDAPVPHLMKSLEFADYENAIKKGVVICDINDTLDVQHLVNGDLTVKCKDALTKKFYFGGKSFRLMQTQIDRLIPMLESAISKVSDKSTLLKGLQGAKSRQYVHTLMAISEQAKSSLISEFVLKELSLAVDMSFVTEAKSIMPNNPSWQGWVFELESICKFRSNVVVRIQHENHTALDFSIANKAVPYKEEAFTPNDQTVYIPVRWNNACFDFVHYCFNKDTKRHRVTFFNPTVAGSHKFDFQYLNNFLNNGFGQLGRCQVHQDIDVHFIVILPQIDHVCVLSYDNILNVQSVFDANFNSERIMKGIIE